MRNFVCIVVAAALLLPEANGLSCSKQTEVHVGRSDTKVKLINPCEPIVLCPSIITKTERTNTDESWRNDQYRVQVNDDGKVRVERIDGQRWSMNLKFHCCSAVR